ncbi:cytochrome P450 [Chaetomium tenue]|uniref:Cytochrome P450 n=1 Tax=Chaetomium tenue TaxID=1854479 RepID=A0ACB7P004_9PEZI|nr:cytochrome P450 [Chaetomium globosum]
MELFLVAYEARGLLVSVGLAVYLVYKVWVYRRLSAFKGPFSSGWSETWNSATTVSNNAHVKHKEVCDKYGPISRIGPNDLITDSMELVTHMSAARSPYTRTVWFARATRTKPGEDHLFSETNESVHTRRRQQMALGYSGKENLELEGTIDVYIGKLIHLIRSKYLSTPELAQPFDFGKKVQYLAVDVINAIGLGVPLGDLDTDSDQYRYIETTEVGFKIGKMALALGLLPVIQSPWVMRLLAPLGEDGLRFGWPLRHARARIDERLQQETETRSDMLASFVRHGLTRDQLVNESMLQLIAGSDTTSTSIRALFLYLLTHRRVYATLQAEVDAAVADGTAPPAPGVISEAGARSLPYLQACIKEGMRIRPPAGALVPKRVPDGGDTVLMDGKPVFLSGGTNIGVSMFALQLNKGIFGDDAEEFRPERWLVEKDEKKLATMHRVHELIFGYGKYQCLGKSIALMEVNKAVFELVRNFDMSLARPDKPWEEENSLGVFTQRNMLVTAIDRLGDVKS